MNSASRCRILLTAGCGFFFLASLGCSREASNAPASTATLKIGVAEGGQTSADDGTRSLVLAISQEGLTQLSVDGRPVPRLARSWEWENGGRRLRVRLQEGVAFHSGKPLDAAAVARSLKRTLANPQITDRYSSVGDIVDVRADGTSDVVFDLARPSAFLPEDLEIAITEDDRGRIGTGPFKIDQLDPKDASAAILLTRFDRYHQGKPAIEHISIQSIPTLRTAWTSLLRSDVDMVTNVSPDAVEFVRTDDIEVTSYARRYQYMIVLNSRSGPFSTAAVRRAASIAIDRDALVARVLKGQGTAAVGPLWPQHWAYDGGMATGTFDPDYAGTLLDRAGFPPDKQARTHARPPARLRFTCVVPSGFAVLERLALEVQRQLSVVGIDMEFEPVPLTDLGDRLETGNFQAAILDVVSGPTIQRSYNFWRARKNYQGLNVFGYENPEAERLFEVVRTSTNEAAIRSSVRALQRVLNDDPPALFLAWNERAQAVRRRFETVQEPGRDPLSTLWQWRPLPPDQIARH